MTCFQPADILLPRDVDMNKWAVIACDQFSSEPEYWQRVREHVGEAPSSLHLIFPEAELRQEPEKRIAAINARMADYERAGLFRTLENSFVFCERAFGEGQELLILVTELTADSHSAHFIARYGSEGYYRHNQALQVYERQQTILREIDALEDEEL